MTLPLPIPESPLLTGTSLLLYYSLSASNNIQSYYVQSNHTYTNNIHTILHALLHYCTIISGRLGADRSVSHSVLHLSTSDWYPASDGSRYISASNPLLTVLRLDSLSCVKASSPPAAVASEMLTNFCRSFNSEKGRSRM